MVAVVRLFENLETFHEEDRRNNQNNNGRENDGYYVRLMIPYKYVTKLIGAGGCMVKDLSARSNGAHIKVMSDKQATKDQRECLVSIGGTLS